jgi:preprotein translocase subunit SecD
VYKEFISAPKFCDDHQILLQTPGVCTPGRIKELIKGEARLELKAVVSRTGLFRTKDEALTSLGWRLPSDREILRMRESRSGSPDVVDGYYMVEKTPVITGTDMRDARGAPAQMGIGYQVAFSIAQGRVSKRRGRVKANNAQPFPRRLDETRRGSAGASIYGLRAKPPGDL